jgi:hypothetical protein
VTTGELSVVRSDLCGLEELFAAFGIPGRFRDVLGLEPGWPREWAATLRVDGGDVAYAVRDLPSVPLAGCESVRRFGWRTQQRHRPGLEFMVSTGRLHGFESLEERNLLLVLDFTGDVAEVLAQPFRLRFQAGDGLGEHIPDFLAVFRDGSRWLLDVRPAGLVEDEDAIRFAAAAEAALAAARAHRGGRAVVPAPTAPGPARAAGAAARAGPGQREAVRGACERHVAAGCRPRPRTATALAPQARR